MFTLAVEDSSMHQSQEQLQTAQDASMAKKYQK